MSRNLIILLCILSNLLVGNGFLFINIVNPNYVLMLCMSLVCTLTYLYIFKKVSFYKWNKFFLLLFSIFTCYFIMITGNTLSFITIMPFGSTFSEVCFNLFTSLVTSVIGSLLLSWFAFGFGAFNMIWFILYIKCQK